MKNPSAFSAKEVKFTTQCPRTDLNKRFLPRPKGKDHHGMKAYPIGLKSLRIEIPLHRFFKNVSLLLQNMLYTNYIQSHFT